MSSAAINAMDFPFVAELPKREKSRVAKLVDVLEEVGRIQEERGPIIPQTLCAEILGVSRQRISDLVAGGKLESVKIGEHRFVFVESFVARMKAEPNKGGRPRKVGAFRRGVALGEGFAAAVDGEEN